MIRLIIGMVFLACSIAAHATQYRYSHGTLYGDYFSTKQDACMSFNGQDLLSSGDNQAFNQSQVTLVLMYYDSTGDTCAAYGFTTIPAYQANCPIPENGKANINKQCGGPVYMTIDTSTSDLHFNLPSTVAILVFKNFSGVQ